MSSLELFLKGLVIPVKGVVFGGQGTDCDLAKSLGYSVGLRMLIVRDVVEIRQDAFAKFCLRTFLISIDTRLHA